MTDATNALIETWREQADHTAALLRGLDEADWDRPTDLPGWRVRDVAAHLAHLESVLAGHPQPELPDAEREAAQAAPHVRGDLGRYVEVGVATRRGRTPAELIGEFVEAVDQRYGYLREHEIDDPTATADGFAAMLGWSWDTLLHNRIVDVWMHDQDVRRAAGRPGGLDTPAAAHTADMMAAALPMVVAKRAQAPAGSTVVLELTGDPGRTLGASVGDDGRARVGAPVDDPTVRLRLSAEDWLALAGGRRRAADVRVEVTGDADLGRRILDGLAVTP